MIPLDTPLRRSSAPARRRSSCCWSTPAAATRRGPPAPKAMSRGFADSLRRPPKGSAAATSCGEGQMAIEDQELGHGVFMHFVLDGLKGKAADEEGRRHPDRPVHLRQLAH